MARSLETIGMGKEYPGIKALDDVSVRFEGGRICALLGKNGAGKSTLVRILAGAEQPGSGRILVNGQAVRLRSVGDALGRGIATVYQELSLIPELSVAENILLGRLPRKRATRGFMIDWGAARARASDFLKMLGTDLDVRPNVSQLGVAQQQMVEIAKALSYDPSVLMLDEPTSSLARHETDKLFRAMRRLREAGLVIVYITHRLQELERIADSVTVLRDGRLAGTLPIADAPPKTIVKLMFGNLAKNPRPADLQTGPETLMEVRGLKPRGARHGASFALRTGEILGLAGLLGSGRTELLRAIFGADRPEAGCIVIDGREIRPSSPRQMKRMGLALTPENRKEQGLVLNLSVRANICMASMGRLGRTGVVTERAEQRMAGAMIDRLAIRLAGACLPVAELSGGNQQKVVVGKWLNTLPRVILFDEPTRGIDVQAKQQIFQIIWDLSREGIASIVVSSELEELIELCHRILIVKSGAIAGEVLPQDTGADALTLLCMDDAEAEACQGAAS